MKTVTYSGIDGSDIVVEYDDTAPCRICLQPVGSASMGGTDVCLWCDCGRCRFCGVTLFALKESIDGGRSLRQLRAHLRWHVEQKDKKEKSR